jgi:hypothetical protein
MLGCVTQSDIDVTNFLTRVRRSVSIFQHVDFTRLPARFVLGMRSKLATVFALAFILSGALAAYSECIHASNHIESAAENDILSVHCPDVFLNSGIHPNSGIPSYNKNVGKTLSSLQPKIDRSVSTPWSKEPPHLFERSSQQGLFQFVEVYRL